MVRKLSFVLIIGVIVGALAYGLLYYAVVAVVEPGAPKITYVYVVPKPERDLEFFFNRIDANDSQKQINMLTKNGKPIPWHLNFKWIANNAVYSFVMDNRMPSDKQERAK